MKPELRMAINGISGPSTDEEATSHISPDSKSSSIPSQRISAIWFSRYGSTFDKIMRAKERKNLGLVLMIRAGSCTKVNTMLFPSKTDVWLTSIWASPLTAGLSSWRYLWKKSIFNVQHGQNRNPLHALLGDVRPDRVWMQEEVGCNVLGSSYLGG